MRVTSEVPARPERGLFGVLPPGRPTDLAVAALVGTVQLGLTTVAATSRNASRSTCRPGSAS